MKTIGVVGSMTLLAICAFAAQAQETQKQASANVSTECKQDLQTFCKDVKPGGGRLMVCLKEKFGELSPVCKSALEAAGVVKVPPPSPVH